MLLTVRLQALGIVPCFLMIVRANSLSAGLIRDTMINYLTVSWYACVGFILHNAIFYCRQNFCYGEGHYSRYLMSLQSFYEADYFVHPEIITYKPKKCPQLVKRHFHAAELLQEDLQQRDPAGSPA